MNARARAGGVGKEEQVRRQGSSRAMLPPGAPTGPVCWSPATQVKAQNPDQLPLTRTSGGRAQGQALLGRQGEAFPERYWVTGFLEGWSREVRVSFFQPHGLHFLDLRNHCRQ